MMTDDCTDPGRSTRITRVPALRRIGFATGVSWVRGAVQLPNACCATLRASAGVMSPTMSSVAADGAYMVRCQFTTSSRVSALIVASVPADGRENGAVLSNAARMKASAARPAVRACACWYAANAWFFTLMNSVAGKLADVTVLAARVIAC